MFDGVFTKNLVNELKDIENVRINKFIPITNSEFALSLSKKNKLLISINSNNMNIRLTSLEITANQKISNFEQTLKKYLESSIINSVYQYNNDRIIIIDISSYDDLGYLIPVKMIIELFGRNSNIILTTVDLVTIDTYKRLFDDEKEGRIIFPKYPYKFPLSDKQNPYITTSSVFNPNVNCYEGISTLLYNQLVIDNSLERINYPSKPVLISNPETKKIFFYCFDLPYLSGERLYFKDISSLLEYYFLKTKKVDNQSDDQIFLHNYIKHQIDKLKTKISKQQIELQSAKENLNYEKIGNLLSCNLHLIHKGDKEIEVVDFYNNNQKLIIKLDPLLYPNENLKIIFNKYHKSKRAIEQIKKQIELATNDLEYFECLLIQVNISRVNDLLEIFNELNLKTKTSSRPKNKKPNYTIYHTNNNDTIWVGKNNIQNNYLTNSLAKNNDYFFHVQGVPGSHVIVRTLDLSSSLIELAGTIAAYYSSYRFSTNVCVDYTLIKNVKKIPGIKGSFVTYTKYKSVFSKPDFQYIKDHTISN